jgi:hypothetical protein
MIHVCFGAQVHRVSGVRLCCDSGACVLGRRFDLLQAPSKQSEQIPLCIASVFSWQL